MLNLIGEVKKQQSEEAQKTLEGLQQNRKSPEHRMKYYLELIGEDADKVPALDADFTELANCNRKAYGRRRTEAHSIREGGIGQEPSCGGTGK